MVLFKRKGVFYLPKPNIEDDAADIWIIPQTSEVFTSYESYLQRMDWYKQKRFTCEVSGRSGMSFLDALRSEKAGSREVDQAFPDALKGPVLRRVQFSTTSRIDNLVDEVFDDFKADFYVGEVVTVVLEDGQRLNGRVRDKAKFPGILAEDGSIERRGFSRYFVRLIERPDEEALVDGEHIVRDRKIFTKQMLRSFIKNCVTREAWTGAPWLVKPELAVHFRIDTNIPPHLQYGYKVAERKAQRKAEQQEQRRATALHPRTDRRNAAGQLRGIPESHASRSSFCCTTSCPQRMVSATQYAQWPPPIHGTASWLHATYTARRQLLPPTPCTDRSEVRTGPSTSTSNQVSY